MSTETAHTIVGTKSVTIQTAHFFLSVRTVGTTRERDREIDTEGEGEGSGDRTHNRQRERERGGRGSPVINPPRLV